MDRSKKEKRKDVILLVFLALAFFVINYRFLDNAVENILLDYETAVVERVIDGDTVVINSGESVRLLGINAPERGENYFDEATKFLEDMILNKTVRLEYSGKKYDKYGRLLAYLHIGKENVNIEVVRNGFANVYILDDRKNEGILRNAWGECITKNVGICEKSADRCSGCIELKKLDYTNQKIIFYNKCSFICDLTDWEIKDEGRKNYFFHDFRLGPGRQASVITGNGTDTDSVLYWSGEDYVWTGTGDTLFLRDKKGKLVLWRAY
jgi:endonuclease YncB( thermonuclease family)